ncbi:translation initiation factor [Pseudobacteriovorax antillogorgiicola]|uniref:Translation initiation factor 1 (eIF-1/SUI1) n=1 Tax=Pseudobacteriovorax antillogorgiicola TaxID=1513793 RepID=A0A1Y6BTC1_9BACT|nr:translation initiation factor [Pseudobacteriovorax antillogorgiicola]TCS53934.1 translation initiation factor 1 (eIF-1/SUI1) [Pseudobacteriovorax antillogorgiicola]SMF20349.1 translation initiation factor 1 (eIF-1/SUI1) [Pseudobacteriovorax antillogorgiicola]
MSGRLLYSTDGGSSKKPEKKKKSYEKSDGPTKMRLETKGRGGKSVTVLFNLPFDSGEAKKLMKEMQTLLGCGATFKEGRIEMRGDLRDKVEAHFQSKGLKIVRAGG